MDLRDEKYMLLTTFRRDEAPVATPVWVVGLDSGELGFWTSSGSGKAKRIAHTPSVTVQACDGRGRAANGSAPLKASARLVTGGELDEIRARVVAKYGLMTKVAKLFGTATGVMRRKRIPYGDRGVVITLSAPRRALAH